jgi:hypothetical protein
MPIFSDLNILPPASPKKKACEDGLNLQMLLLKADGRKPPRLARAKKSALLRTWVVIQHVNFLSSIVLI